MSHGFEGYLPVNSVVSDYLGEAGDFYSPTEGYYYDFYKVTNLAPGYSVTVNVESNSFDTYVGIYNAGTGEIQWDNNSGSGTNAQITFAAPVGDQDSYYVLVSSAGVNSAGGYTVSATYS